MKCWELVFDKNIYSSDIAEEQFWSVQWCNKTAKRACSWVRKNEHKKYQERKYHLQHHLAEYSGDKSVHLQSAIYLVGGEIDWRSNGYVNFHQRLYRSARGDIRVYHGKITAHPHVFAPVPTRARKPWTALANRRMRYMKNVEESCPRYSYLKKQFTYLDDGL